MYRRFSAALVHLTADAQEWRRIFNGRGVADGVVRRRPPLAASGAGVGRVNRIVRGLCAARETAWPYELRPRGPGVGRSFATRGCEWTSRARF